MKKCSKCKQQKELDNFSKIGKYLNSWCNECRTNLEQERRIKNGIIPKIKPIIKDSKHKECLKCHKILHIDKFRTNKRGRLSRSSYCKKCDNIVYKEIRKKNPEKYRKHTQNYRDNHREHLKFNQMEQLQNNL